MRYAIAICLLLMIGATCSPEKGNLTRETTIAAAIDKHATASAVYAECLTKNAVGGAGGNTKNCDELKQLYINYSILKICEKEVVEKKACYRWLKEGRQ